jgi:hypothetical protein
VRRRKGGPDRVLLVVISLAVAVIAAQTAVMVRLLLDRRRAEEERSEVRPISPPPRREDVSALPPQDPHSPPTGSIRINRRPPGAVPEAPDTDADSGSVGQATGQTLGDSTRAGERSLS